MQTFTEYEESVEFFGFPKEEICRNQNIQQRDPATDHGGPNWQDEGMGLSFENLNSEDTKTESDDVIQTQLSCPENLTLRQSRLPAAGCGVWSVRHLPKGVWFGPFFGESRTDDDCDSHEYSWQVFGDEKQSHFINAKDSRASNWMRYVNFARYISEQNLVAFQYCGEVYYKTRVPIKPNTELLVWYGEDFTSNSHIPYHLCNNVFMATDSEKQMICNKNGAASTLETAAALTMNCCLCMSTFPPEVLEQFRKWVDQGKGVNTLVMCKACTGKVTNIASPAVKVVHIAGPEVKVSNIAGPVKVSNVAIPTENKNVVVQISPIPGTSQGEVKNQENSPSNQIKMLCQTAKQLQEQKTNHDKLINQGRSHSYNCVICGKGFNMAVNLSVHMLKHRAEGWFPGKVTDLMPMDSNQSSSDLSDQEDTESTVVKQEGSEESQVQEIAPKKQVQKTPEVKPYNCSMCQKGFMKESSLTVHLTTHREGQPYSCAICGKRYLKESSLTFHMNSHLGEQSFQCGVCGKGFTEQRQLTNHMNVHTTVNSDPFGCNVCGKAFKRYDNLLTHMRTHNGERPYTCVVCGKGFTQQSNLITHFKVHSEDRPFACDICGRKFKLAQDLPRHTRTHTGEKPYACTICGTSFKRRDQLTRHMKTHNCNICGKEFTRRRDLFAHMKVHSKS